MPLVRIDLRRGRPPDYRKALCDGVYRALRETFNVPDEDRFMVVNEHDGEDLTFSRKFLGIERGHGLVMIQLTVSNTRSRDQKKALFARIVELLSENPGVRPQDVMINLIEVKTEDWSFGNGIAQYVVDQN
ncbi:MAG TPA: tautomerase family protein [Pseudolabrys sp.]|nr:tautomerase family protein [Pseudolabrys sp.]